MFSRFINIISRTCSSLIFKGYLLYNKRYHISQFLYWTAFRCCPYFAIIDNATMSILLYVSLYVCERSSLWYLEAEFFSYLVCAPSILPKTDKFLSKALIPTPNNCVRLPVPQIITNICYCQTFKVLTKFLSNVEALHCCLNLHFHNSNAVSYILFLAIFHHWAIKL